MRIPNNCTLKFCFIDFNQLKKSVTYLLNIKVSRYRNCAHDCLKHKPFELLLLYLFESKSLRCIYLNLLVGRKLNIVELCKLFPPEYIIYFDSCFGS